MQLKLDFDIDDVVYTASAYGVERQIIEQIKISDRKHKVEYGFKSEGNNLGLLSALWSNNVNWYDSANVFADLGNAQKAHERLVALKKKEDARKEKERREDEVEKLKAQLAKARAALGVDDDDYDEDFN